MKKVARLRLNQDEQFVPPPGNKVGGEQPLRTTGRIKKPKAVFDPSDNYMPRAQRLGQVTSQPQTGTSPKSLITISSPTTNFRNEKQRERSLSTGSNTSNNSLDSDMCFVCQKREPRRGGNYRNRLISCTVCNKKVHKLCSGVEFLESAPVRQNYKCENCRSCEICSKENGEMITCAKCLLSYHFNCHTPKVIKNIQSPRFWKCVKCAPRLSPAAGNKESLPVNVIRHIIGDEANLQPLPKARANSQTQVESSKKSNTKQDNRTPERAAVEASSSSSSSSSFDEHSDNDNDEDYDFIEKKRRKLMQASNHNSKVNGDAAKANKQPSQNQSDTEQDKKPILIASNHLAVNDLPNRKVISSWKVEEVVTYFEKYFPYEAHVFKEQEIDGNALLLLKRSDVVQKLPLKLGPSLRLYNLILKMQTQKPNDHTLGWDCSVDTLVNTRE